MTVVLAVKVQNEQKFSLKETDEDFTHNFNIFTFRPVLLSSLRIAEFLGIFDHLIF
jgi:hypothetical protein